MRSAKNLADKVHADLAFRAAKYQLERDEEDRLRRRRRERGGRKRERKKSYGDDDESDDEDRDRDRKKSKKKKADRGSGESEDRDRRRKKSKKKKSYDSDSDESRDRRKKKKKRRYSGESGDSYADDRPAAAATAATPWTGPATSGPPASFGRITDCIVKADQATGRSRGFGIVEFSEPSAAENSIDRWNNRSPRAGPCEKLIEREKARIAKDYRAADDIRSELGLQGITINDLTRTWTSSDGRSGPRPSAYDDPSYSSRPTTSAAPRPGSGSGGGGDAAPPVPVRSRGRRRRADDDDDSRKSDDDDDAAPAKEAAPANEGDD
ncbi:hypothetical protein JL722_15217 [Aureococcus anophagefferens]|nr:hypothetical protein JL722_15217 [Aureococcus anophagefferens]